MISVMGYDCPAPSTLSIPRSSVVPLGIAPPYAEAKGATDLPFQFVCGI